MEATHQHDEHDHHEAGHGHAHGEEEDWNSEEFVARWLERQEERAPERRRQFALIRALLPKLPDDEFSYINLGAGAGNLDEVLLEQFHGAQATLVDASLPMLNAARQRLSRFGDRVEYVQANLTTQAWAGAVGGPFDFAVSTLAVHHLDEPHIVREVYTQTCALLGHGGMLLSLDYVRPARPSLAPLAHWAARDEEAGFSSRGDEEEMVGTAAEHLGWLSEAGFASAELVWKNMNTVLFSAVRDHLHLPEGVEGHDHEGHSHAH